MTINFTTDDIAKRDALLMAWDKAKQGLDYWKEREMEMRKAIQNLCFPTLEKGTSRIQLNAGYELKCEAGINYTLDKKKLSVTLDAIDDVTGNQDVSARIIRWVPELVEREYLLLPKEIKVIFDEIVTSKPASPKLTIEAPKGQK